jgi:hypothetical protein
MNQIKQPTQGIRLGSRCDARSTSSLATVDRLPFTWQLLCAAILDLHNSRSGWLTIVECLNFFLNPDGAELYLEVIGYRIDPIDLLTSVINGDIVYAGSSYYLIRRDEESLAQPEASIYA